MKVILRYAQVVEVDHVPFLPLIHPEEEIMDAPEGVGKGWYYVDGGRWIPPESQREKGVIYDKSCLPPN